MIKQRRTRGNRRILLVLCSALILGACTSNGSAKGPGGGNISQSGEPEQLNFVELASLGGDNRHEDPILFNTIDGMLDRTDVAVVGKVTGVRPGRSIPVGRSDLNTFTFEVSVDQVLYGDVKPGAVLVFEWYLHDTVSDDDLASVALGDRLLIGGRLVDIDAGEAKRHPESLYGDSTEVLFPWNQAFIAETVDGEVTDAGSSEPPATTLLFGELSFDQTVDQIVRAVENFRSSAASDSPNGQ